MKRIFIDIDGVLADWDAGVRDLLNLPHINTSNYFAGNVDFKNEYYLAIENYQKNGNGFWSDLPVRDDAFILMDHFNRYCPYIISAYGDDKYNAKEQKKMWVKRFFKNYKISDILLPQRSLEKSQYADENSVLIDDQQRVITKWIENKGIGILHIDSAGTILKFSTLDDHILL